MNESKTLLKIAVERGYLGPRVAGQVLRMAKLKKCSAERILKDEKLLSDRRVERLVTHRRYRTMRKADKAYGLLAIRKHLVTKSQVMASFNAQRESFENGRDCVRLGADLIDRGLLTNAQDRVLRAEANGTKLPSEMLRAVSDVASSEATLALHEASKTGADAVLDIDTTYRTIDDAVRRVDAIRAIKEDMSTSDNVGTDGTTRRRDSANEIENALTMLARRRNGSAAPAPAKRKAKKKKTTGLMRIFNLAS
jgi:hypothetical protein